ncbi:chemotaxis protein CheX [Kineococcus gynurae]|uniref:Chemotaxis protein CheX n=1 Tax=Kineococcus gynurae TaxID=452979 RepID=A0ABV5LSC2_9ACTN
MSIDSQTDVLLGDEDLAQIVAATWESYLDHVDGLLPAFDPHPTTGPESFVELHASVVIDGPTPSLVSVLVGDAVSGLLAAAMLHEEGELPDEDVADALGEIANVIGGNVKAILPEVSALGLPQVLRGKIRFDSSDCLARHDAFWLGHPVTFVVTGGPRRVDEDSVTDTDNDDFWKV